MKLIKFKQKTLNEIFQALDIKFAFVKKNNKAEYAQVHTEAKCRDFLGDVIWSRKTKEAVNIYSFQYDFKENPYDIKKTRLSIKFPTEESLQFFKTNFVELNTIEKTYNVPLSIWKETDCKQTLIIEASSIWQSALWKLSYFTYLLKVISYESKDHLDGKEKEYSKILTKGVEDKLMKNIRKRKETIQQYLIHSHNNSGFVSICKNHNKEMNKIILGGL